MSVKAWLQGLGLGHYEQAFRDNDINANLLPTLTDGDLRELGVASVGHRKQLLVAITNLSTSAEPPPGATPAAPLPGSAAPQAERRQLTVMFVDLVGSTTLSSRLDPEDMREILYLYQNTVTGEIARIDGHVAKLMGDGVLAYFGWPRAGEDDAERAVQAGLAITEAVGQLSTPAGEPLAARVGIATGLVVVGDLVGQGAAREEAVVGETPNLAARLQDATTPGTVVIADSTRRLLGEMFELREFGPTHLKGFAHPVSGFQVLREHCISSRFEAQHSGRLLPIIGRDHELALMLERWRQAAAGEGQAVLLVGEAGIGKSRLLQATLDALSGGGHVVLRYQCSPHHTGTALWPVAQQIRFAAGLEPADTEAVKLDKLDALLRQGVEDVSKAAPLVAALLGINAGARYPAQDLTPHQHRTHTLAVLIEQLLGLARRQPVLMTLEDTHWIDPTTLGFLGQALNEIAEAQVLMLVTSRPDNQPTLGGHPHVTQLTLNRLGRSSTEAMIELLTGAKTLAPEVLGEIAARTDGVPLFIEEVTKAVLEAETAGPGTVVPASLHASLMARLDRVPGVKEVAQAAACIGREFTYGLLAVILPLSEVELQAALERLAAAELIFSRGTPPEASYAFKHALVRDAVHESLLKRRRQQLHARIAVVLEERFPETIATEPEVIARHLSQAELHGRAVEYWHQAGAIAVGRSANLEAIAHFSKALAALETQPESRSRSEQELAVQTALAVPLVATKGTSGIEVERAYTRAQALCEELGKRDELFLIRRGLWNCYLARGQLQQAYDLAVRLSTQAKDHGGSLQRALAHRALGSALFFLGRFAEALDQADHAIATDDALRGSDRDRSHFGQYGERPGLISRLYAGWALWFLGFPDRAVARFDEALPLAEKLGHAHSQAFALAFAASMRNNRRDFSTALQYADAATRVAAKHDLPLWLGESAVARGFAEASLGNHADGIERLRSGISGLQSIGDWHHRTHWLGLLATAYLESGAYRDAEAALKEAFEVVTATRERYFEPELERLRGTLLLQQNASNEAAAWFQNALLSAACMGAKSLELRAAMSLARLWNEQGRRAAAYDLLAPIHGWFTEGFGTPDLVDAEALLLELRE